MICRTFSVGTGWQVVATGVSSRRQGLQSHMAVATDHQRFHDFFGDDVKCQSHILADVEASVPADHRDPESSIAIGERRDLSLE